MKHPVPSISATMEEIPERHTCTGQIMVSLDILCVSIDLRVYLYVLLLSSSIHYRHNGGGARKAHVKHSKPCESRNCVSVVLDYISLYSYQPVMNLFRPPPPLGWICKEGGEIMMSPCD